jgi:hypothetical protein
MDDNASIACCWRSGRAAAAGVDAGVAAGVAAAALAGSGLVCANALTALMPAAISTLHIGR